VKHFTRTVRSSKLRPFLEYASALLATGARSLAKLHENDRTWDGLGRHLNPVEFFSFGAKLRGIESNGVVRCRNYVSMALL
jgi:hypothetical protein